MSRFSAFTRLLFFAFTASATVPFGFAQVQPSALSTSLKGKDIVSKVAFGQSGWPSGGTQSLPVNTFIHPDGTMDYRAELAILSFSVTRLERSFGSGTRFKVDAVDIKSDRLELKLAADNTSTRVKFLFGTGWLTRTTNDEIRAMLGGYFALPDEITTQIPGASSLGQLKEAANTPLPATEYHRPTNVTSIPNRISEVDVQRTLAQLAQDKKASEVSINRDSDELATALKTFKSVYGSGRDRGANLAVQAILVLQDRLGPDLKPKSLADLEEMNHLYARCMNIAAMRQSSDNGREYGPGANSAPYQRAFLSREGRELNSRTSDDLRTAAPKIERIDNLKRKVLQIEDALDKGDLLGADRGFQALKSAPADGLPEVAEYLRLSSRLSTDLEAYARVSTESENASATLIQRLHILIQREELLALSTERPLTSDYMQHRLTTGKSILKSQLEALPSFQLDQKLMGSSLPPSERLGGLQKALSASSDLVSVLDDKPGLEKLRGWYGDDFVAKLLARGKGVDAAQSLATSLATKQAAEERRQQQERAQQQELANTKANLARNIVNSTLFITKLDEQFRTTEIMGYSIEAQKQRQKLNDLVTSNRTLLTQDVWQRVREFYVQALPNLTVRQATHAQEILAGLRQRF